MTNPSLGFSYSTVSKFTCLQVQMHCICFRSCNSQQTIITNVCAPLTVAVFMCSVIHVIYGSIRNVLAFLRKKLNLNHTCASSVQKGNYLYL